jgi:hypothetical protein
MHDTVINNAKSDSAVCGVRLYVEQNNHVAKLVYGKVGLYSAGYEVYESDFTLSKNLNPHRR